MRAPGGPRLLLRRLREVMAEPVTAQARLDRIVVLIASNMVAEVCSLYVVRADGAMELFATEGLNREAVHLTTMRPGEGLVGLIVSSAEPLALSMQHLRPSPRPETGGEIFQFPRRASQGAQSACWCKKTGRARPGGRAEALQTTPCCSPR
jgi:phosphotransferase system enzyme I (PtsP)